MKKVRLMSLLTAALAVVGVLGFTARSSGSAGDLLELVFDDPDREEIDPSIVGVNAFFNTPAFGTIPDQFREIKNTLGLRYVRVLFAWNDGVQPSKNVAPNFGFYDSIIDAIPQGVDVLIVLTDVPSWMRNSANWIDGNPRKTFAELWVKKVAARYGGHPRVVGWQIWNEPNNPSFSENDILAVTTQPDNYIELVALSHSAAKSVASNKLVVNGATTAINQNYPGTLNYNRDLRDGGIENFIDIYAIHIYGKQFENFVRDNGIEEFFDGIDSRVWVTESGAQGVNSQLAYVEQMWPFMQDKIPHIERVYYYQFVENTPAASTYGLRNLTPGLTVSDLYILLRDRRLE